MVALMSLEFGSGARDRTYRTPIEFQSLTWDVSARVSGEIFEVGHIPAPDRHLLGRVVEAWPSLNTSLKLAILAIVDAASVKGGES
jgi:hypothetical protein